MNPRKALLTCTLVCLAAGSSGGQEAAPSLVEMAARVSETLARVEYNYVNELVGTQNRNGLCICIDGAKGVFITRDVPGAVPLNELKDFYLLPAQKGEHRYPAELMGSDPEQNFTFIRLVPEKDEKKLAKNAWLKSPPWKTLAFSRADLTLGQGLVSVGLLGAGTGNEPCIGTARVAALLRLPYDVVYVTGGDLTGTSSPVLTLDGRAIGMVGGQVPMEYRMLIGGRWTDVAMAGRDKTSFFVPAGEFAHVLGQIPEKGATRSLPWLGIWTFKQVTPDEDDVMELGGIPAVLVGQPHPGGPADKAGIKQSDAIIGMNGKPLEELPTPALTAANFQRLLGRHKPGEEITLTIFRQKRKFDVKVVLTPLPPGPDEAPHYYNRALGLAARDLVDFDRYAEKATPLMTRCVLIALTLPNSPSWNAELRGGDLLTHIGETPIPDVATMEKVLKELTGKSDLVQFRIQRRGEQKNCMVKLSP